MVSYVFSSSVAPAPVKGTCKGCHFASAGSECMMDPPGPNMACFDKEDGVCHEYTVDCCAKEFFDQGFCKVDGAYCVCAQAFHVEYRAIKGRWLSCNCFFDFGGCGIAMFFDLSFVKSGHHCR